MNTIPITQENLHRMQAQLGRCVRATPVLGSLSHALQRSELRARQVVANPIATRRRAGSAAHTLELLARAAESGSRQPRNMRAPRSVTELAPEAHAIRELATLLRARQEVPTSVVTACDRFADGCWNGALKRLDHEYHRRQIGRLRFLLLC
jgi:hypothetical protein